MARWWRRLVTAASVVALGLSFTACGSSKPSASSTSTTSGVTVPTTVPLNVPNQVKLHDDVDMVNCGATKGGWSAGGTAKSSLRRSATYLITVFFTSSQATDLAYGSTSVHLAAGQSKLWSVQAAFDAPSVLRGVAAR
jgi:hypothetical protein